MKTVLCALIVLLVGDCETVSKEEQARRANQRQTDYVTEIDRRHKEAEKKENETTDSHWWMNWLCGGDETVKASPRELTEEELKPRR